MADDDKILQDLQADLQRAKSLDQHLSTLARQGNDKLVQEFLTDNVRIQISGPLAKSSQLYVACFWGIKDTVQKLLELGTNPNFQNSSTLWTPLHAAAFQEHGPVVMLLLEYGAEAEIPDAENRTAAQFASASDVIWPLFAALNIPRTPRSELVERNILRPGSGMMQTKSPSLGINIVGYKPSPRSEERAYFAAVSGDVLANQEDEMGPPDTRTQPNYSIWK
ncbi:ankyrin repeat and SOCS box protein 11-like [Physella acuta]|uniref:ankyrin repeat and SOCS box protein 11-like n=1 Tax=Physella acuta TaxID=109671 RepID=UPI0027DCF471|nr:ankyrin repeat and SOCS box protein 11-like [Physella acuta]